MIIKDDFVTNSSSTNYIIGANVKFNVDGEEKMISKCGQDVTTLDMIKMIEGMIQYELKIKEPLDIIYNQYVEEAEGSGWNDGDYTFSGGGDIFFGSTKILEEVMTKKDLQLFYNGSKIQIPTSLVEECKQKNIKEKYKDMIKEEEDE